MIICNKCKQNKNIDLFYKKRKTCIECCKIYRKNLINKKSLENKLIIPYNKICNICNINKLSTDFYTNRNQCKKCMYLKVQTFQKTDKSINYQKIYREKNKLNLKNLAKKRQIKNRDFLWNLKKSTPCKDCGNFYHPVCMDYDHTDNNKYLGVSKLVNYKRQLLLEEISKCDLVCSNCHRLRTHIKRKHKTKNK